MMSSEQVTLSGNLIKKQKNFENQRMAERAREEVINNSKILSKISERPLMEFSGSTKSNSNVGHETGLLNQVNSSGFKKVDWPPKNMAIPVQDTLVVSSPSDSIVDDRYNFSAKVICIQDGRKISSEEDALCEMAKQQMLNINNIYEASKVSKRLNLTSYGRCKTFQDFCYFCMEKFLLNKRSYTEDEEQLTDEEKVMIKNSLKVLSKNYDKELKSGKLLKENGELYSFEDYLLPYIEICSGNCDRSVFISKDHVAHLRDLLQSKPSVENSQESQKIITSNYVKMIHDFYLHEKAHEREKQRRYEELSKEKESIGQGFVGNMAQVWAQGNVAKSHTQEDNLTPVVRSEGINKITEKLLSSTDDADSARGDRDALDSINANIVSSMKSKLSGTGSEYESSRQSRDFSVGRQQKGNFVSSKLQQFKEGRFENTDINIDNEEIDDKDFTDADLTWLEEFDKETFNAVRNKFSDSKEKESLKKDEEKQNVVENECRQGQNSISSVKNMLFSQNANEEDRINPVIMNNNSNKQISNAKKMFESNKEAALEGVVLRRMKVKLEDVDSDRNLKRNSVALIAQRFAEGRYENDSEESEKEDSPEVRSAGRPTSIVASRLQGFSEGKFENTNLDEEYAERTKAERLKLSENEEDWFEKDMFASAKQIWQKGTFENKPRATKIDMSEMNWLDKERLSSAKSKFATPSSNELNYEKTSTNIDVITNAVSNAKQKLLESNNESLNSSVSSHQISDIDREAVSEAKKMFTTPKNNEKSDFKSKVKLTDIDTNQVSSMKQKLYESEPSSGEKTANQIHIDKGRVSSAKKLFIEGNDSTEFNNRNQIAASFNEIGGEKVSSTRELLLNYKSRSREEIEKTERIEDQEFDKESIARAKKLFSEKTNNENGNSDVKKSFIPDFEEKGNLVSAKQKFLENTKETSVRSGSPPSKLTDSEKESFMLAKKRFSENKFDSEKITNSSSSCDIAFNSQLVTSSKQIFSEKEKSYEQVISSEHAKKVKKMKHDFFQNAGQIEKPSSERSLLNLNKASHESNSNNSIDKYLIASLKQKLKEGKITEEEFEQKIRKIQDSRFDLSKAPSSSTGNVRKDFLNSMLVEGDKSTASNEEIYSSNSPTFVTRDHVSSIKDNYDMTHAYSADNVKRFQDFLRAKNDPSTDKPGSSTADRPMGNSGKTVATDNPADGARVVLYHQCSSSSSASSTSFSENKQFTDFEKCYASTEESNSTSRVEMSERSDEDRKELSAFKERMQSEMIGGQGKMLHTKAKMGLVPVINTTQPS